VIEDLLRSEIKRGISNSKIRNLAKLNCNNQKISEIHIPGLQNKIIYNFGNILTMSLYG